MSVVKAKRPLPKVIDESESAFVRMILCRSTKAFLSIFCEDADTAPIASKPINKVLNMIIPEVSKTTSYTYSTHPDSTFSVGP